MTKHTLGPWECWDGRIFAGGDSHITGTPIAEVSLDKKHKKQYEHNCFLIASAPDLLAVLKELQESAIYWSEYDVPLGIVDRINAAIAKAEL